MIFGEASGNGHSPDAAKVDVRVDAPSGTIVLNFKSKRNAMSRSLMDQLTQAFQDLHLEKRVRAVILTGAGDAFCSGTDLQELQEAAQNDDQGFAVWFDDVERLKTLYESMLQFPKPIIAAVNGMAAGTGLGLVAASDIVVAAPSAQFSTPEPKRGLVSGLVTPLLAFRIGGGLAADWLLRSKTIDARRAFEIGLVHELVETDLLWAKAQAIAAEVAESAAESILITKRMLYESVGEDLTKFMASAAASMATARTTEAAQEGITAFLEKRSPKWP